MKSKVKFQTLSSHLFTLFTRLIIPSAEFPTLTYYIILWHERQ